MLKYNLRQLLLPKKKLSKVIFEHDLYKKFNFKHIFKTGLPECIRSDLNLPKKPKGSNFYADYGIVYTDLNRMAFI